MILRENITLSAGDFTNHPFWHWCEADVDANYSDDIDTASTFRPHLEAYPVPATAFGYAAATAVTADGRRFPACVFYTGESDPVEFGLLLHPHGQIDFRHRIVGETSEQLKQQIGWLTAENPARLVDCFPITCHANEGVLPTNVSLHIDGFDCIHILDADLERRRIP